MSPSRWARSCAPRRTPCAPRALTRSASSPATSAMCFGALQRCAGTPVSRWWTRSRVPPRRSRHPSHRLRPRQRSVRWQRSFLRKSRVVPREVARERSRATLRIARRPAASRRRLTHCGRWRRCACTVCPSWLRSGSVLRSWPARTAGTQPTFRPPRSVSCTRHGGRCAKRAVSTSTSVMRLLRCCRWRRPGAGPSRSPQRYRRR
mmetsp:Transcript_90/g.268  ORF Transcript_90/g.268 Transcript_90/m.268 type:complete len:205 (+) Transcript_90:171-785(+)